MINLCACMGPMYGEPFCYCQMKQLGREEEMKSNPLRIAERERFEKSMKDFFDSGGFERKE